MSTYADLIERVATTFDANRNRSLAVPMRAYMRSQFEFFGIAAPDQRRLARSVLADVPPPRDQDELAEVARALWTRPERELQYLACDEVVRHIGLCSLRFCAVLEELITTKSWWDTVDILCRHGAGVLVRRHPTGRINMDRWLASENLWLIRSSILHMERWGADTDEHWLFAACLARADHTDFFVRKAIGWALRSYAHVSPIHARTVKTFVEAHENELSPLSRREALNRVKLS